jgi:hypothetical protein
VTLLRRPLASRVDAHSDQCHVVALRMAVRESKSRIEDALNGFFRSLAPALPEQIAPISRAGL